MEIFPNRGGRSSFRKRHHTLNSIDDVFKSSGQVSCNRSANISPILDVSFSVGKLRYSASRAYPDPQQGQRQEQLDALLLHLQ